MLRLLDTRVGRSVAGHQAGEDLALEGDVVVCSDHPQPKEQVMALAEGISSLRAVDGGSLANARYVEELTVLLLNINRIHKARTMVRLVGLDGRP